jgi:hypothetical protein
MSLRKENGDPFFQIINCFQICAACLKLERVKQINCTHIKSTAHWLSSKKIRELKLLYKASPEDAIREFGGVVVSDYRPALRKEEITQCFAAPLVETTHAPKYIFTTCDPNGGGPSHMSIVSGYFSKTGDVVVRKTQFFLGVFFSFLYWVKYVDRAALEKLRTTSTMFRVLHGQFNVASTIFDKCCCKKSSKCWTASAPHKFPGSDSDAAARRRNRSCTSGSLLIMKRRKKRRTKGSLPKTESLGASLVRNFLASLNIMDRSKSGLFFFTIKFPHSSRKSDMTGSTLCRSAYMTSSLHRSSWTILDSGENSGDGPLFIF